MSQYLSVPDVKSLGFVHLYFLVRAANCLIPQIVRVDLSPTTKALNG